MFTTIFIIYLMAIKMVRGQLVRQTTRFNEFAHKNTLVDFNYHNHENVEMLLRKFAELYPHLSQLYSIGKSAQGWSLLCFSIVIVYVSFVRSRSLGFVGHQKSK